MESIYAWARSIVPEDSGGGARGLNKVLLREVFRRVKKLAE